jgi:hypothetical protein
LMLGQVILERIDLFRILAHEAGRPSVGWAVIKKQIRRRGQGG